MFTPCLITLSRSTVTNCWGTLGRYVVARKPISGRLRAAAMNVLKFCVRNSTSLPARSSRTNVNPPEVPTPGIAGGEKSNAIPSGISLNFWFSRVLISWNCSALDFLASQSSSVTKKNAL